MRICEKETQMLIKMNYTLYFIHIVMMKPGWMKRKIIYNDLKNIIKKEVQVSEIF